LTDQAQTLASSKRSEYNSFSGQSHFVVDDNSLLSWKVRAKNLLVRACGEQSQHFIHFQEAETSIYSTSFENLQRMQSVFKAAREDFEAGYLASVHDLVRAEVFGSELEQASELLKAGYNSAAAVVAGVVLETAIRDLCGRYNVTLGKVDKMNADLTKAGAYNIVLQKRITHLAAVRNSAAHGNEAEFKTYDVSAMIGEVEQFIANHLA